jgi:hypothetical protein
MKHASQPFIHGAAVSAGGGWIKKTLVGLLALRAAML